MKKLSKNFAFMFNILEHIRSKADYHKLVDRENLKMDCIAILNNNPINYN